MTCNEEWKEDYIDRTLKENKLKPLLKLLKIKNFAFYFQSDEWSMVSIDCTEDEDREAFLHGLFPIDADIIWDYDYMIEPITLEAKMRQYN